MPRRFQFSLRSALIVLTVACLWIGRQADKAHRQRAAVKEIEAMGGVVQYAWQPDLSDWPTESRWSHVRLEPTTGRPNVPAWLRAALGDDYFQEVKAVALCPMAITYKRKPRTVEYDGRLVSPLGDAEVRRLIPHLQSLGGLRKICLQDIQDLSASRAGGGGGAGPAWLRNQPHRISDAAEASLRAALPRCEIIHEWAFNQIAVAEHH